MRLRQQLIERVTGLGKLSLLRAHNANNISQTICGRLPSCVICG